jgi:electron transfer flavoprotein alpha subunit
MQNIMQNITVIAEQRNGKIAAVSLELLGEARRLCGGGKVTAVLAGYKIAASAEILGHYGADEVYILDGAVLKQYTTELYAAAVERALRAIRPDIVLFGASAFGRDLAPRLSARLDTGLTADCTKLEIDGEGRFLMTRPAFGGNLFATIVCPDKRPQMSTVRPGVMKTPAPDTNRAFKTVAADVSDLRPAFKVRVLDEADSEVKELDIAAAPVLVSCGRGAAGKETLAAAEELARLLGGSVGSSRALVDGGVMPQRKQVGQTGKTVRPGVYLAAGISGAVQHLAGMSESEFIIAVNKDAAAPIFAAAHFGVVGDASKILPATVEKMKVLRR